MAYKSHKYIYIFDDAIYTYIYIHILCIILFEKWTTCAVEEFSKEPFF